MDVQWGCSTAQTLPSASLQCGRFDKSQSTNLALKTGALFVEETQSLFASSWALLGQHHR